MALQTASLGRRSTLTIKEQVDGYVEQLERFVVQCVLAKNHEETADVFLWSAQCSLEAMLRALLAPYPPRRFTELSVKGLLEDAAQRTIVPQEMVADFEAIWRVSRVGTRVRDHKTPDYSKFIPDCSRRLARVVTWFYEKSPARRPMSTACEEGLEALRNERTVTSREDMAHKRQSRLIRALERGIAERQSRLKMLSVEAQRLTELVAKEEEALGEVQVELDAIRASLTELEGYPRFSVPQPRQDKSSKIIEKYGWVIALAVGAVLGVVAFLLIFGISVGEGAARRNEGQSGESQGEHDSGPDAFFAPDETQAKNVIIPEEVQRGEGSETEESQDAEDDTNCASGMIEFLPAEVRVIQPFPRRSWPPGPKALKAVKVGHFCMDRDPVLVSDYEKCAAAGRCRPRITCLDHPRNFPVNCVTWEDANTYCRWRGGTLPSVVQWERTLLPGGKVRAEPSRGTWEWVNDPFPAQIFERGSAKKNDDDSIWGYMALQKQFVPAKGGRRILSWHKAPASASRGNLSFRCAQELIQGE